MHNSKVRQVDPSLTGIFWTAVQANQLQVMDLLIENGIVQHSAFVEPAKDSAVRSALVSRSWDTVKALLRVRTLDPKTKYAIIGYVAVHAPEQLADMVDQVSDNPPNYPTSPIRY